MIGLSVSLPAGRPAAAPAWFVATARRIEAGGGVAVELARADAPPVVTGLAGLAAPCSLPEAFARVLAPSGARDDVLRVAASWRARRLFKAARAFARGRARGTKHPARFPHESLSALDRRRLARFHAAVPLLRATPLWDGRTAGASVFEVDAAAVRARGVPFPIDAPSTSDPDARDAILAAALAAHFAAHPPPPPDDPAAWAPLAAP